MFDYLIVTDSSMDVVGTRAPEKDEPKARVVASGDVKTKDDRENREDLEDSEGRAGETTIKAQGKGQDGDESKEVSMLLFGPLRHGSCPRVRMISWT